MIFGPNDLSFAPKACSSQSASFRFVKTINLILPCFVIFQDIIIKILTLGRIPSSVVEVISHLLAFFFKMINMVSWTCFQDTMMIHYWLKWWLQCLCTVKILLKQANCAYFNAHFVLLSHISTIVCRTQHKNAL